MTGDPLCVFLAGEGPNDIGGLAREPQYRTKDEGFLQPLVRTLIGPCTFVGQKVTQLPKRPRRSRAAAETGKLERAAALALSDGAQVLVFHLDADRRFDDVRRRLQAESGALAIPCALAVPKETIEAWALADERALQACEPSARAPRRPEDLWGAPRDAGGDHPKVVLRRTLGRDATTSDFAAIAGNLEPAVLAEKCPMSFPPFSSELKEAAARARATVEAEAPAKKRPARRRR